MFGTIRRASAAADFVIVSWALLVPKHSLFLALCFVYLLTVGFCSVASFSWEHRRLATIEQTVMEVVWAFGAAISAKSLIAFLALRPAS